MYYRIVEVSTALPPADHTYIVVEFWRSRADFEASEPAVLVNDFLMALRSTRLQVDTDDLGRFKTASGQWTPALPDGNRPSEDENDPWSWVDVEIDVGAKVHKNIVAYYERAQARGDRGSKVDRRIERDQADPHKVLARADVKALRGATRDNA